MAKAPPPTSCCQIPNYSQTEKMLALVWKNKHSVKVENVPRPLITEPHDCIVRITVASICGSDLHLLHNSLPGSPMKAGEILGHEGVGVVEEVGPEVKNFKRGDRVVISAVIGEGNCRYCKEGSFSLCDCTNNSAEMYAMFGGHRCAGVFGYSSLYGGYPGLQAEYARVPHADVNLLKLPSEISDEKAIFLSDALCTAWHACEIGEVTEGKTVAIWGCGPVGLLAQKCAWIRGAKRVIGIDSLPDRLAAAQKIGSEVINYKELNPVDALAKLIPGGPDVCIDCVGFRYAKGLMHAIESTFGLETDVSECLDECIKVVRKNGIVAIIGDYAGYTNHFPIGAAMTKALTIRGSQVFVQKYWQELLQLIQKGHINPTFVVTHDMSLEKAAEAYETFDTKLREAIKILLRPPHWVTKTEHIQKTVNVTQTEAVARQVPVTTTVPVTKIEHVTTTVPVTTTVDVTRTDYVNKTVPITTTVPVTKVDMVTKTEHVTKSVPVTKVDHIQKTVPVTTTVPVTRIEYVTKTVPVTTTVEVTRIEHINKTVPITTTVPVTRVEQVPKTEYVTKSVPVTRTEQVTKTVPVTTTVDVERVVPVTTTVPVTKIEHITKTVPVTTTVPITVTNKITEKYSPATGNYEAYKPNEDGGV